MNIHPAVVHFPIALLVCYAALEVLSAAPAVRRQNWAEPVKAFLVIVGTVAAMVTLQTGELAERAIGGGDSQLQRLVETHAAVATASTYIFGALAIVYAIRILERMGWHEKLPAFLKKLLFGYQRIVDHRWVLILGAVLGFLGIMATGSLGGAIVYGPDVDPFVKIIYNLFF